jgi:glycosyltransferase involved in cell wall biosynthesis
LGNIGIRKGAYDLIRAFGALPEDVRAYCHLTLAGDGDTDKAQALAQELGCAKRVAIPGWIGKAAVERLLADSDVLVLPSYAEGMAMALVEAMSWGLPVVTTSVGGAGDFLEQGRNCLLVSPGDVGGIRDAMANLARDPELRLQLGLAARDTISRFSIDTYISTLSALYEELAGSQSGGSFVAVAPTMADRNALARCSGGVSLREDSNSLPSESPKETQPASA